MFPRAGSQSHRQTRQPALKGRPRHANPPCPSSLQLHSHLLRNFISLKPSAPLSRIPYPQLLPLGPCLVGSPSAISTVRHTFACPTVHGIHRPTDPDIGLAFGSAGTSRLGALRLATDRTTRGHCASRRRHSAKEYYLPFSLRLQVAPTKKTSQIRGLAVIKHPLPGSSPCSLEPCRIIA